MKIVPQKVRDAASEAYAAVVVALKKTSYRRPVSTVQAASTQATLNRDPLKDAEHFARAMPENWKANPNAKTTEEAIGMHPAFRGEKTSEEIEAMKEVYFYRHMQRREDRNSIGQPSLDFDKEKRRDRAIEAFMSVFGTGRRYWELTADEKKKIRTYYVDFSDCYKPVEVKTVVEGTDEKEIDRIVQLEKDKVTK